MKRTARKHLTREDRVLWTRVARTAKPLPGKAFPEEDEAETPVEPPRTKAATDKILSSPAPGPGIVSPRKSAPPKLDAPTRDKIARGRVAITGRVDLHGLRQEEAHMLLLSFLRRAYEADRRYLLVITGKGSSPSSEGVLRRAVPQWFATAPFRQFVSGYEEASRQHGGEGAIYVRLRRREQVR
ncbi:Smr/MutS family protein [Nitratireductor luteus]|uniref:Smr/MutS family protein n=1 Tax=Nitratireductor luteus TaxID=2976980 RepID=UPI00223F69BF|nr:Smr/MutS family protein [Nitratireductor luteus]